MTIYEEVRDAIDKATCVPVDLGSAKFGPSTAAEAAMQQRRFERVMRDLGRLEQLDASKKTGDVE